MSEVEKKDEIVWTLFPRHLVVWDLSCAHKRSKKVEPFAKYLQWYVTIEKYRNFSPFTFR